MSDFLHALFSLRGRVALVTGGAGGIGLGIAETLARAGARVVISGRNLENAEKSAAGLRLIGCDVAAIALDPSSEESIVGACRGLLENNASPWILVNNAGMQDGELLLDASQNHWDQTYATNLRGPALLTREFGRAMIAAGAGGRIINISSRAVQGRVVPGLAAYVSMKAGLVALSMASASEFIGSNITVNTVLPGGVLTPGAKARKSPEIDPKQRPPKPPLGFSEPRDVAAAVLYFASPAARFITNQMIAVDAGFSVGT
jgi:NAD(P)-dependent dehydrogenase (short-subunit alcohol dehydrogenase family)